QLQGNRAAAAQAYTDTIAVSERSGNVMMTIAAAICLGQVQESNLQFELAVAQYQQVLALTGEPPWPTACEAYLGLARIAYERNDLERAQQYAQQSLPLAQQLANVGTPVSCWLLLTRIQLARHDITGATQQIAQAEAFAQQQHFRYLLPDVAAVRVLLLLRQGAVGEAAQLVGQYDLPLSQVRVLLAQADPEGALALLTPLHRKIVALDWRDELLKVMVLEVLALDQQGDRTAALTLLKEALTLAETNGAARTFIDEGVPMATLLRKATKRQPRHGYSATLLAAFASTVDDAAAQSAPAGTAAPSSPPVQPLIEPLSERELEVLDLIAQGLSNRAIGERLFIALDTVKGHNRKIFGKLQVQRRTEAVARARDLGLV
ncbi:MAG: hypothetical protein KDE31_34715, partial [Caldilineaceae bacterium]|nr:hypothetical protein [Caldilineaceae bacterium]